jgi:hypothetical protein
LQIFQQLAGVSEHTNKEKERGERNFRNVKLKDGTVYYLTDRFEACTSK